MAHGPVTGVDSQNCRQAATSKSSLIGTKKTRTIYLTQLQAACCIGELVIFVSRIFGNSPVACINRQYYSAALPNVAVEYLLRRNKPSNFWAVRKAVLSCW